MKISTKTPPAPFALVVVATLATACSQTAPDPATPPSPEVAVAPSTATYPVAAVPKRDSAAHRTTKLNTALPGGAEPIARTATEYGSECVVGVWASVRNQSGDAATLSLNYPRESAHDYAMHLYMGEFPIVITPESRAWVEALPSRESARGGPPALLFRSTSSEPWRVVRDAAACPGDPSEALAWSKGG